MISAGDFRNGITLEIEGQVVQILEFQHVKPGKGAAFVRTKLKNVINGGVVERTFRPTEKFPAARIDRVDMQYLYADGDLYNFMNTENYEQLALNQDLIGDEVVPTERTTPESLELQELFARMRSAGCTHVVMEASSHALALDRVYGIHYAVGIFTNLTQDHLDFHKTMEAYCDAKAILFQNCDVGVCNADDPWTERLLQNAACRQYFYAEHAAADLRAEHITLAADHIAFDAVTKDSRTPIKVGIPGGFMVYNTLDVLGAALALGVPLEKSARVLAAVPHVKGRVEVVPTPGKDYTVLIDYSHTPDSLENILRTVKGFAKGRTVALFGCGGDRDRTKRPIMGSVAAELADFVVVTSDNPRTEDPEAIIADILPGLEGSGTPYQVICDRVEAIHWAMDHAQPGDVIALCGKGHETYQEVNHEKHHMDEREIVAEHLTGK